MDTQDIAPTVPFLDQPRSQPIQRDMVWVAGGIFRMGSDVHHPEEKPAHRVSVDGFWIERTPVTNRQFREFVGATDVRIGDRRSSPQPLEQDRFRLNHLAPTATWRLKRESCSTS